MLELFLIAVGGWGSYVVEFNKGGRIVWWFVAEDQLQLEVNWVLKLLKKCLKSEI